MTTMTRLDVDDLAAAAAAWLETLSERQRTEAAWPFESGERGNWHYAPRDRHGVPLRAMTDPQRDAARGLLTRTLSDHGVQKADAIMALEDVLRVMEAGRGHVRDPLNYSFTVFGEPGRPPWGWRVEGHHLILNVTVAPRGAVAVTPSFWGANPARIPFGERAGERVLAREYHVALELARTLTPAQRRDAVVGERSVGNIITERGRGRALPRASGLACADLDDRQRAVLVALLGEYVGSMRDSVAVPYLDLVRRDLGRLRLAWAGGMAEGEAFYYRIHGSRVLVEFDCTADDANHIHSVWRDPENDWGRDVLGEHYRSQHDDD
jgi:hypothetical protein